MTTQPTLDSAPTAAVASPAGRGVSTSPTRPRTRVAAVVLDSPDPRRLAAFYTHLLGWEPTEDGPDWVTLVASDGGAGLSFQAESAHRRPTWPAGPKDQQMMLHLDIEVDDLEAAIDWATAGGATVADHQPQPDVRVLLDPAGHPFCLFLPGS